MRDAVIALLDEADLDFTPGGDNLDWKSLLSELADIEESYVGSLVTLEQRFELTSVSNEISLASIRERFAAVDVELGDLFDAWSPEDYEVKLKRADGWELTRDRQLEIFVQAILIVVAKAAVYLKSMNRPLPESVADWIG